MDLTYSDDEPAQSGGPVRCQLVLVPAFTDNPLSIDDPYSADKAPPPTLTLDLAAQDPVEVIDPTTNAVITWAGIGQITATPELYWHTVQSAEGSSISYQQPLLVLEVPGMRKLRIGQRPIRFSKWNGEQFRYAWRGKAPHSAIEKPTHLVTAAEWPSLVEKFGLSERMVDDLSSGRLERRERSFKVFVITIGVPFFIVSALFLVWVFAHAGLPHPGRH
jgi:hypothetical protein